MGTETCPETKFANFSPDRPISLRPDTDTRKAKLHSALDEKKTKSQQLPGLRRGGRPKGPSFQRRYSDSEDQNDFGNEKVPVSDEEGWERFGPLPPKRCSC